MARKFFQKIIFGILISLIVLAFGSFLIYKNTAMPKIPENFEIHQPPTNIIGGGDELLIGVISDTHVPSRAEVLPREIEEIFKEVDLIIHAGDIENLETLGELEKISLVFAVEGNMDFPETKEKLPEGLLLKIYDWKIGIVHSPFPFWLGSHFNWIQEKVAKELVKKQNLDILIFGHTHVAFLKELDFGEKKIFLINSGSPTVPFFSKASVCLLKITKDSFKGEIIFLEK
ncbi:metallophosphoesterase [Patescibacteria group bacterium]|nr:metallophosphoesterase [Patescibacteria group bacterium]